MPSRILFLSPFFPDSEGVGPARRAHAVLSALATRGDVVLFVIGEPPPDPAAFSSPPCGCVALKHMGPRQGRNFRAKLRSRLARRFPGFFARVLRIPPDWNNHGKARLALAASLCARENYDIVHAFRFSMAPYALAIRRVLRRRPRLHLDVDDIESATRARLAGLHRAAGNAADASKESLNAAAYARLEPRLFKRFDRLYACSPADAARLGSYPARVRVLPNPAPSLAPAPPPAGGAFVFLFIGTLSYFPNEDALRWFCDLVLPRLRTACDCELAVAGIACPSGLETYLRGRPGVRFLGRVDTAADAYKGAHAVIAPLRAGGGTRIKIIEAFAFGRPVVCTPAGVEGIAAIHGRHCLVAGDADSFHDACLGLVQNPGLREELASAARSLAELEHSGAALAAALS